MYRGDIAFATLRGGEPAHAADIERLDGDRFGLQPADQYVEPDAVAADDDKIGEVGASNKLDFYGRPGRNALNVLADSDEPVGLAEGGYRA